MTTWNGKKVKDLRKRLGLTQEEMAQELGIHKRSITGWENGEYEPQRMAQKLLSIMEEKALYGTKST